jgi:hypothetical protein
MVRACGPSVPLAERAGASTRRCRARRSAHPAPSALRPPATGGDLGRFLQTFPIPEIPVVSIVDLGIVREADGERVLLTPHLHRLPATHVIETMVRDALDAAGFAAGPHRDDARRPPGPPTGSRARARALRAYGIAPPVPAGHSRASTARNAIAPTLKRLAASAPPLQGPMALPLLRRAVRPFQMPLTPDCAPAKAGAVDDGAAQQGSGLRRST